MKVILLKDVKSLGKKGEIVEVSEGYGRNFIIPTKAGVLADAKNLNTLKLQVQNAEKIAEEKLEEAEALKKKLEEVKLIFHMKAGKDGRAFGSISTKEVQEELKKQYDISVDKKKMELDVPMKNFGGYDIKVKLHKDVEATLHVSVQSE
ncbi:50S ribosomal protein L9 [Oribacterium asaccharolyticum ACB7]|jgi:ribosomal protein L9|uniref:Large ribosomal subunit protein bL9 n=1 Tax=Oribacterium asaccharolyticum ACB7 TaxID=796944 RepID=G9WW93_9FIRM|nr:MULTISPECIES: 50S ribosomal protein L9 [Oribacterium]EGL36428.1 ribosomal protein L9 [Oribacterium sp. oral taxon 108 str. F0425]EHL10499.1 50S ribosomal protein L9 [Oribacterium asaccharolyticum ACB7]